MEKLLNQKKSIISKQWLDIVLQTYQPDTAEFLRHKKDPFANPVGNTIYTSLQMLLDEIIAGTSSQKLTEILDPLIRIRAVQRFTASQALSFIFLLKKVLREALLDALTSPRLMKAFLALESRIDEAGLIAFDIYMACKEKTYQLQTRETKKTMYDAIKRAGLLAEEKSHNLEIIQ